MSRPDLVKDTHKALRLLRKFAAGELTLTDMFSGLGKGDEYTTRAEEGVDEKCELTAGCTAPKGHDGGCCLDVAAEVKEDDAQVDNAP